MKTSLKHLTILLCVALMTTFVSCGDDEENTPVTPPAEAADAFDGSSIVGKWQLVSLMACHINNSTGETTLADDIDETDETHREFDANGDFRILMQSGASLSGTYQYDESDHQLRMSAMGDVEVATVTRLTNDQLIFYATYQGTSSTEVDTLKYLRVQP